MAYTRGWAANSINARIRLRAQLDQANQEIVCLRKEIGIKDARLEQIDPHRRPHYPPTQRMAILELRAARNWSLQKTATVFLVTPATIASWMKRLDEQGPDALIQLRQPVNRFPDLVRYAVQRLKRLCPSMGKVKIAQVLASAGLHLWPTTVGRIINDTPPPKGRSGAESTGRVVTAKRPNHVWHVDLSAVPFASGFCTSWLPFSLPQLWPFCWWIAVAIDHYSRRVMGFARFERRPNSEAVRAFLGRTIRANQSTPKCIISDKGPQFWCDGFKTWCKNRDIKPRF